MGNGNGAFYRPNTPTNHTHAADASRASGAHRPTQTVGVNWACWFIRVNEPRVRHRRWLFPNFPVNWRAADVGTGTGALEATQAVACTGAQVPALVLLFDVCDHLIHSARATSSIVGH